MHEFNQSYLDQLREELNAAETAIVRPFAMKDERIHQHYEKRVATLRLRISVVEDEPEPTNDKPLGGDAVRLAGPWDWGALWVKSGDIGIYGGSIITPPESASITFHHSTYRDDTCVSCSGGPATMWTDATELQPTDQTRWVPVWRFKDDHAQADNAIHYRVQVRLWDWTPRTKD